MAETNKVRAFETGATRQSDEGKIDIEGHLSPLALMAFCEYMDKHRILPDGSLRASDNWQKGMPIDVLVKSLTRHFFDVWLLHRGHPAREPMEDALCGILFNAQALLHELRKEQIDKQIEDDQTY